MTLDQILDAASHLPREQMAEVVDRLLATLHGVADTESEQSWRDETRRRLADLESGQAEAVPGDSVSERVRRIVGR